MQKGGEAQLAMTKGLIHQEDRTILNVSALNKSFEIWETETNTTARENKKTHCGSAVVTPDSGLG